MRDIHIACVVDVRTLACIVAIGWWLWYDCYAHLHALLI